MSILHKCWCVCGRFCVACRRPLLPHSRFALPMFFQLLTLALAFICFYSSTCPFIVHVRFASPLCVRLSTPLIVASSIGLLVCCCYYIHSLHSDLHTTYFCRPYLLDVYYYNVHNDDDYYFWLIIVFVFRNIWINTFDWMVAQMLKFTWFINCAEIIDFEIGYLKELG